jgi:predicted ATPase
MLQELYGEIRNEIKRSKTHIFRPSEFYGGWGLLVLEYCLTYTSSPKCGQALYLFGGSGFGKSFIIEKICDMFMLRTYMPLPGQFFMGDFSASDMTFYCSKSGSGVRERAMKPK